MPFVDILRYVLGDRVFVSYQSICEARPHLGRDLVSHMQKLTQVKIVLLA